MFVPNLKIITIRRKTGYRASKPIKRKGEKRGKNGKLTYSIKDKKRTKKYCECHKSL